MAADREDSGIMEIVAIAVLLFMFWRFYIKDKDKVIEPATTPGELKDEFARDPNFNLNDYCKDVIYRPLSSTDLTPSNILGEGWCYRGDRSAVDESKGFGDAYAEKQAEEYQEMKQEEAVFVNSKSVIQFRLINSTESPITTDVLNTTQNSSPVFNPIPDAVVVGAGTGITSSGFTASWDGSAKATGYYIDVATDDGFLNYVSGYENLNVGNVLTYNITGLLESTNYYYRVRAYNTGGTSNDSNVIIVTTKVNYNDWFFPSKDELNTMWLNLYSEGVGGFRSAVYISSTELDVGNCSTQWFSTGENGGGTDKDSESYVRPIRSFTDSVGAYNLRDRGPAGGWICYIDGTTYYEAAPEELEMLTFYSNVIDALAGASGTAIGTGAANTAAIIAQVGHTESAAKVCDDLEIDY